jgi:hypothetical protein
MKSKGQFLVEIVLGLGLLVFILGVVIVFLSSIYGSSRYQNLNQSIAISGFENYRNALISISQTNWDLLSNLSSSQSYYLYSTSGSWQIATGEEKKIVNNEIYRFSFTIGNYQTDTLKFVTTTVKYSDLVFEDYFLLPKLNVSY